MKFLQVLFAACVMAAIGCSVSAQDVPDYDYTTKGTRIFQAPGSDFVAKILVETANLGSEEVKIAELAFPADYLKGLLTFI